jgi:hypothetical protein
MDGRLQRLLAALRVLFNPPLVITLQRSVRKKRDRGTKLAAGMGDVSMHRRGFLWLSRSPGESVINISFVIIFTKPLGDCFAE